MDLRPLVGKYIGSLSVEFLFSFLDLGLLPLVNFGLITSFNLLILLVEYSVRIDLVVVVVHEVAPILRGSVVDCRLAVIGVFSEIV